MKKLLYSFLLLICFVLFLIYPDKVIYYTFDGLTQWALKIVPTLFPFMVISSIMLQSGVDIFLIKLLVPILHPLFQNCSNYGIYVIAIGFLCGFPMGAKTTTELYNDNKISIDEANYLLTFCNNIGPSYFLGLIVPILKKYGIVNIFPFIYGMYGIPLTYGIILGFIKKSKNKLINKTYIPDIETYDYHKSFSFILKTACCNNAKAIIILGSYIAFISSLRTIPDILPINNTWKSLLSIILEINSGIKAIYQTNTINCKIKIIIIMTALSFSGLSCFLQTACFFEQNEGNKEKLSFKNYFLHRIIISLISLFYTMLLIYFPK